MPIISIFRESDDDDNSEYTSCDEEEQQEQVEKRCFFGLLSLRSVIIANSSIYAVSDTTTLRKPSIVNLRHKPTICRFWVLGTFTLLNCNLNEVRIPYVDLFFL